MKVILTFLFYGLLLKACIQAGFVKERKHDLSFSLRITQTRFYLYTNKNPTNSQELDFYNEKSVKNSYFNNTLPTKILIHGWLGSYKTSLNIPLRESYLSQGDFNIISVDWEREASSLLYIPAVRNIPTVGRDVSELVKFLNEKFHLPLDSIVIIGHSLGAHIAGYCGKWLRNKQLSYIVALDPASTFHRYSEPNERLDITDAKYVITLQTDANTYDNRKGRGFLEPMGYMSFYPNWGRHQPGCNIYFCSHLRSISIYAEAVRGHSFHTIYKCQSSDNILERKGCTKADSDIRFGDPTVIKLEKGIYNFYTNSREPYGKL